MAEPKNTGKGKETIGGIVIAVILFLLIAWRRQRTVRNFFHLFQESPVTAIVLLLIAVSVVAGIALFRKYRKNPDRKGFYNDQIAFPQSK